MHDSMTCNIVAMLSQRSSFKDPGTALMETKPIQVYTNENRLKIQLSPQFWLYSLSIQIWGNM